MMNLKQTIIKVLREEKDIPINIRRRFDRLKKLVEVTLSNSHPCDFLNEKHYFEGILYDLETFLLAFEMEGITEEEIISFIINYFYDDIIKYYINSKEDC